MTNPSPEDPTEHDPDLDATTHCVDFTCDDGTSCDFCVLLPKCTCPGDNCIWIADRDGDGIFSRVGVFQFRDFADSILTVCSPPPVVDCDDADPTRYQAGYFDRDGDGYVSGATCSYPGEPDVVFQGKGRDCDDSHPDHYVSGYIDRDGDGITGEFVCGSPSDPIRNFRTGQDCDDSDPEKTLLQFANDDADGWGDPSRATCGRYDETLTYQADDCDDADPSRPSLLEIWGDETDSDCDGADGTVSISNESCSSAEFSFPTQKCDGINLILDEFCASQNCASNRVLRIGNNGTTPFVGSVSLESTSRVVVEMDLEIAPGDATRPFTVGELARSVHLVTPGVEDCNPAWRSLPDIECIVP